MSPQTTPRHEAAYRPAESKFGRYLTIVLVVLLTPVFVFGATIAATGMVTVEVHEPNGANVYIPVPALLLDLAFFVAPLAAPEDALDEARAHIAPYREAVEALAEELENCPSGVIVEVKNSREHVLVTKTWRNFEVEVDSPDAQVRVQIPARLLSSALDIL